MRELKQNEVFKDESGNPFTFDRKTGQKIAVQMTKDKKPFFLDAEGNVVLLNTEDQPKTVLDESGKPCVMVAGKMQVL